MRQTAVFALRALLVLAAAAWIEGANRPKPTPYAVLGEKPYEYTGPRGEEAEPEGLTRVAIGLYVTSDGIGPSIRRGAELAVAEANRAGGFRGIPFELIVKSADKTWGSAREVVDLAYEHKVWAVIGGVDAESSHVAEQIATKAQLPLISPATSEASLTEINIPWMFRMVPGDDALARVMVEYLHERKLLRVLSVVGPTLDDRSLAVSFAKELADRDGTVVHRVEVGESAAPEGCEGAQAAVVFASPGAGCETIDALRELGCDLPVLAGPGLALPNLLPGEVCSRVHAVVSLWARGAENRVGVLFETAYRTRFGEIPDEATALAYDSVGVLVAAIRRAGLNRARIRDELSATEGYIGVTGLIELDGTGSRVGEAAIRRLR